jgi:myo-inositol-1(or 4)-monophosphatase
MLVTESTHLSIARRAAAAGAKIASRYFADLATAAIQNKHDQTGYQGIVTKADVESEQTIIEIIRQEFPGHQFLAEEEHAVAALGDSEHLWIIDPLDGTNNFAHGIPHYAISVAYYVDGEASCGCIISPESGDEFIVERGRGAWHNGKRASVNQHTSLSETMLAVGFYYDRGAMMRATLAAIDELFNQQIHGIRRMGTAALDICQVALGRFGGYFEYQLSPWDFAAAQLFLEEAGGKITTCTGDKLPLEKTSVLATNTLLHEPLLAIVRKHADYLAE